MKILRFLFLVVAALALYACTALPAYAADKLDLHVAAGANGAWFTGAGSSFPVDGEVGGHAWSSLTPHISVVGGVDYGLSHSYVRWQAGSRVTASDVSNPDFNTFLGIVARGGSTKAAGAFEWAPDAGFGWKPDPVHWPRLTIVGEGSYGLTDQRAIAVLGLRYEIPLN